jgi:hypothetical protein
MVYWATGLTPVYLEGSLDRTRNPLVRPVAPPAPAPAFDGPAPPHVPGPPPGTAVLNPLSVYRKGEALLRDQLHALSPWHLVNIILAHELSDIPPEQLNLMPAGALIELIVAATRLRLEERAPQSSR